MLQKHEEKVRKRFSRMEDARALFGSHQHNGDLFQKNLTKERLFFLTLKDEISQATSFNPFFVKSGRS